MIKSIIPAFGAFAEIGCTSVEVWSPDRDDDPVERETFAGMHGEVVVTAAVVDDGGYSFDRACGIK